MANHSDIVIFTDDPGWHGRELCQALKNKGYQGHYLSLTDCSLTIQASGPVLNLPGITEGLPAAAFVRGVPGGTLEQVIFRLNILHILKDLGIPVMNDGRAIERTVDKAMTSYLLNRAGIPTPETHIFESLQQAHTLLQEEQPWVIKPLFGSQGIGVQKLSHELLESHPHTTQGLFYLQRFINRPDADWQDIRVMVIKGQARLAMLRKGRDWITNRTQGAECVPLVLDSQIRALAEDSAKALDIDYCGVDVIYDEHGRAQVLEVNSIPAWWGLQKTVPENIAELLIDTLIEKIPKTSTITSRQP